NDNSKLNVDLPPQIHRINCTEPMYPDSLYLTKRHLAGYMPTYRSVLPSTIIPNWSFGTYAACASIATDQPEALRVIGFAHADGADYYDWLTHYEPIIHRFVAVSEEIAANIANLIPHRRQDIETRPYAVELPKNLQRNHSCHERPLQLIYAGRISEKQKRVSDLIRLIEALDAAQVDFQFRIIGEGSDKGVLNKKIELLTPSLRRRVGLEDSISPEQMPGVWQSADIFILVSDYEGTSIAMLEAMAYGCVPVVTKVSGTAAVIDPGRNGHLISVGDIKAMAQVIKQLDNDRRQLAMMAQAAHQTVLERFTYEEYLDWFLEMVDDVWQQPPRSWPAKRPLLPQRLPPELPELYQEIIAELSGQDIARYISSRRIVQAVGFKIATQPGFGWLSRLRGLGRRLLGG
ncbi:MAG: glycosyltransferase family 4 protein, partial [Chloroflexi bacterium]|nr:glycosyltransferase family 4 protein [Chloroflexota bacterium]